MSMSLRGFQCGKIDEDDDIAKNDNGAETAKVGRSYCNECKHTLAPRDKKFIHSIICCYGFCCISCFKGF